MKKHIDKYFKEEYDELVLYASKMYSSQNKFNESPDALISSAYIYLIDNIHKIEVEGDVKNFVSTYIYHNTIWNNGYTELEKGYRRKVTVPYETIEYDAVLESSSDVEEEEELKIKAILLTYEKSKTLEEKAVWELYFEEGWNTVKKFSKNLGMSRMPSYEYIKDLRERIKANYNLLKEDNQ